MTKYTLNVTTDLKRGGMNCVFLSFGFRVGIVACISKKANGQRPNSSSPALPSGEISLIQETSALPIGNMYSYGKVGG